jgi:hypothetical protein
MCLGIAKYTQTVSQSIVLTRADQSARKDNRKAMCPKGWCADALKEYLEEYYPKEEYPEGIPIEAQQAITMAQTMSCDEFPFAISAEGGDTEHGLRFCIPSAENSWQGGVMSGHFKGTGIKVGEKFTVKIEGFDCRTMKPVDGFNLLMSRDVNTTNIGKGRRNTSSS